MVNTKDIIASAEPLSTKYQAVQAQLLIAYDALENLHSFVSKKPTDYENYKATAQQKEIAVRDALTTARKLEPAICG